MKVFHTEKKINLQFFPRLIQVDRDHLLVVGIKFHYPCVLQAMSSVHLKADSNASSNIVTSDSSIDFSLIVKEYTGLITFVNETPPPGNHQLSYFLFPFYVYAYLFLLENKKFQEAQRFISMYSRLFLNAEGYAEVVQDLVKFKSLEDFQDHSYLKNFCDNEHGYKVQLSAGNMKLLKEYLKGTECRILSHILHRKFNIEVIEDQSNQAHATESPSITKKESTTQRTESSESILPTRRINIKTNSVIEDQSSHENITETSSIKKKESTSLRTEISESISPTRRIVLKKANNIFEDQSNQKHTGESSSIKRKELTTKRTKRSENISTKCIDIKKRNNVIENRKNHEHTTEAACNKEKESTSQRIEISEINSPTKTSVKETKDRLLSEVPGYHYTISCRKEQLCCVDINEKNTLLSCGFESSEIHIWNIDPNIVNRPASTNSATNESNCLATNFNDNDASSPSLRCVLKGHSGGVYGLAYASGLLMSCSEDATARAWSMTDFKDVRVYCDHKYPIWDIAVSSNCTYFATASLDCTARLWSFNRSTPLRIFVGHSSDVDHVRFHSNNRYLATASADKTIQLWAVEDGRSMRSFPGHDTHINSIAFSPDGKHIASADDSGCIKIWDLASGKLYREIVAHSKKIFSISYNSDSSLIASCGIDRYIRIWDMKHSLSMDEKGKSEVQATSLVDSHSIVSVPHYIAFHQNDFLISVGAQVTTEYSFL